ncbi:YqkE family protein [Ureibacillus thermophilus]|uniref:DUF3886 domain-containing protein n=1 Tax=Ureibacillus thermophilus TaxID=367743 RepID=A0A4V1A325_9BACL|nr:YqkE family protein [Ureibacillus thermophilus]QBK25770.1 DUF3886 domain-containing protein [Ureibacillus thermophilus]
MAKKKKQSSSPKNVGNHERITLQDQLNQELLEKLKAAKKELLEEERKKEEERQARLEFERKQREKNMSFEELLEKYGNLGSKY